MRAEMERCAREGTPRPESSAVRAHVPACFWSFANSWQAIFREGVCDHAIKELCRVYISRTVKCEYCGNQRSVQAAAQGPTEASTTTCSTSRPRTATPSGEKAALATRRRSPGGWRRRRALGAAVPALHRAELVELGCFIALTMGQQSWLRLLNIEHHEVLAGTAASMAPGFDSRAARRVQAGRGLLGAARQSSAG